MARIVPDHCVPRSLLRHLALLDATTIGELGWADMDDGPLLDLLASACDVCLTTDRNLEFQQRLDNRSFATVVLFARRTDSPTCCRLSQEFKLLLRSSALGRSYT